MLIDILTIGDVGIDIYYLLDPNDACVRHIGKDREHELCFDLSEKIPVDEIHSTVGGNAANVAIGTSRLGLVTSILTEVGNDEDGRKIIHTLEKEDVNLDNITRGNITNQTIALVYKGQRTLLVHHQPRKYLFTNPKPARWIYLTSTNIGGDAIIDDIVKFANDNNSKIAFSPGTIQIKSGPHKYNPIIEICDLIVMNKQEAQQYLNNDSDNIELLLSKLQELGPGFSVITDGINGSYGFDGDENYKCKSVDVKTLDNTGAGDAYSAALVTALAKGENLREAMKWGSVNSASVVQFVGPQKGLLSLPKLQDQVLKNFKI